MKKLWQQPKLLILARSEPEEAVLASCKTGTTSGTASQVTTTNGSRHCKTTTGCGDCSALGAS
jgi:hypothetical protein